MNSIPEQLSAARSAQLEAQFALFRSLTTQAFDSASRVIALNISTSRDSVERSSKAVRQLIAATGPSDLAALRQHAEEQVRSLFTYSRELFKIASGGQAYAVRPAAPVLLAAPVSSPAPDLDTPATVAAVERAVAEVSAPLAKAADTAAQSAQEAAQESLQESAQESVQEPVQAATQAVTEQLDAVADAVKAETEQLAAYVQEHLEQTEPAVVAEAAEPVEEPAPVAKPKPIARVTGKGAPKAAVAPHPAAAPVADLAAVRVPKAEPGSRRKK